MSSASLCWASVEAGGTIIRLSVLAEARGATNEELHHLLRQRRAKLGIFEGDLEEGELEIGQVSSHIQKIQPASEVLNEMWDEYNAAKKLMCI